MKTAIFFLLLGITLASVIQEISSSDTKSPPTFFDSLGFGTNGDGLGVVWDAFFGLEPEVTMDTMDRIRYNGFPAESHETTTQDGHILKINRIPSKDKSRLPVVLVHGTFSIADCWLGNNKENSLAFLLADAGLDVWLLNLRGCQNSLGHIEWDSGPFSKNFWAFTFDEMANYDMPASVDYILQTTGHSQLHLIGHSLGGALPILMLADNPQYNDKVKAIFSLAPVGNLADFTYHIKWVANFEPVYQILTQITSLYELHIPISKRTIGTLFKIYGSIYKLPISKHLLIDAKNWNFTRAPNYLTSTLSSTSYLLLYHYNQFLRNNGAIGLRHYNWGEETNVDKYGDPYPSLYNLSCVRVPVHLYYGSDDPLISETNVRYLKDRLPNVAAFQKLKGWDHVDFIWAKNAAMMLYNSLIEIIKKCE